MAGEYSRDLSSKVFQGAYRLIQMGYALADEYIVYPLNRGDFLLRASHQDHPVGLEALLFADFEDALVLTVLVNEHPP